LRDHTSSHKGRLETGRAASFNSALLHAHREVVRRRFMLLAASIAFYAAVLLALGTRLEVSGNYFVALPVIAAALGFGAPGGIVAGALGLPANLLLFQVIGHPEYSPASKSIAELFGLVVGLSLGMLADYFGEIGREMRRREELEDSLRDALAEKELLVRELHHRVKNNLNVMKSLVQLQKSRSRDPAFIAAAEELIGRIFAMALVHDQLYGGEGEEALDLGLYVDALARNLTSSLGLDPAKVSRRIRTKGRRLSADMAMPLGLIVNEIMTNAAKHARTAARADPSIVVSLEAEGPAYRLVIEDDGPGPAAANDSGLGMKLVASLAAHIGGEAALSAVEGTNGPAGTRFELRWSDAPSGDESAS
jgi:two-component sensor histidine kinase